jgi:ABC-type transport system involved in multi-copper enzyme maturation permease subunit
MTTTDRPRTATSVPFPAGAGVTQRRVLVAEAIKLRSVRSTWWLLAVSGLSIVAAGVSPALTSVVSGTEQPGDPAGSVDPTGGALSGISFTQLLVAALAVLIVTGEYSSGLVRATFTAVPARLPVLWAKAATAAVITFVTTLAATFIAFLTAQAVLSGTDAPISLTTPGVARAVIGSALYLGVTAVLAVALGALLRSAIGAMAAVFGLLFVAPLLGLLVPGIDPYLPSNAGAAVMRTGSAEGALPPWVGLGVFVLYAAAALAAAAAALVRRDT